jgi:hypothetical protein
MTTQVMHSGADELEVQRRDICAQHASQAQQYGRWSRIHRRNSGTVHR